MNKLVLAILAFVAAGAALFAAWYFRAGPGAPPPAPADAHAAAHFIPVKDNGKFIRVRGWKDDELKKIATDFAKMYGVPAVFDVAPAADDPSVLQLTFPGDIEPTLFFYLVNYIKYPKNIDERPSVAVAGHTLLGADFRLPSEKLVGSAAWVYVPENDTTYDVVYVRLESGETWADSFNATDWTRADDARMGKDVEALARR